MAGEPKKPDSGATSKEVSASSLLGGLPVSAPTARTEPGVPAPGETIGEKYVVERTLGKGGMGVVLAARHARLGHLVAIKLLQGKAAHDEQAAARFLREARAAATLSSEHVAKVHDIGTLETGEPYLVMEYLSGVDLGVVLHRDGPMPVPEAVSAILQACEAVAEAHAAGIVHRDLKPSNLFRIQRSSGTPLIKVLDFGISKMTSNSPSGAAEQVLTSTGMTMGSPQYMSPEQVRNAKDVDGRADIWALGVVLYELLTGKSPFGGETLGEVFANIISMSPARVESVGPGIPEGLGSAIAQCLERERAQRPQTIAELASRLAPFASPEAARTAERIVRSSGAPREDALPQVASGERTMTRPVAAGELPVAPPVVETGPPWHTSGIGQQVPPRRPRAAVLSVAAAGALLVTAAVGTYALKARTKLPETPAAASAESNRGAVSASTPAATAPELPTARGEAPSEATGPDAGSVATAPAAPAASPVTPAPAEASPAQTPRHAAPPANGDAKPRQRPHSAPAHSVDNPLDHL
jgi:serine/threonine-protein kinase